MANMIGHYKIHRKIKNNPIWTDKPAWWLKVWLYLLDEAKFENTGNKKRGENWFSYEKIYHECHLKNDITTPHSIQKCIAFLKTEWMIIAFKSTRGFNISISNYNKYQNTNVDSGDRRGIDGGQTGDTITKEVKNKEENLSYKERIGRLMAHYKANGGIRADSWGFALKSLSAFKDVPEQDIINAIDYTASRGYEEWGWIAVVERIGDAKNPPKPLTVGVPLSQRVQEFEMNQSRKERENAQPKQ